MPSLLISAFFIVFVSILFIYLLFFINPTTSLISVVILMITSAYYDYSNKKNL